MDSLTATYAKVGVQFPGQFCSVPHEDACPVGPLADVGKERKEVFEEKYFV